jgi:hypothetical protein
VFIVQTESVAPRRVRLWTKYNHDDGTEPVYYESIKRELKIKPIYECRCDERLKTKAEESTRLAYTGLLGELEHLEIKTRLIDEKFASVMGEYVFLK